MYTLKRPSALALALALVCACAATSCDSAGQKAHSGSNAGGDAGTDAAVGCVLPLDCSHGGCMPPPPLDLSTACSARELRTAQEGACGDYRFQNSHGLSGKQSYWKVKTGTLVAEVVFSDTNVYCGGTSDSELIGDSSVVKGCEAALSAAPNLCQTYHPDGGGTDVDGGSDADGGSPGRFACGSASTCDGRTQLCEHVQGGAPPGVDMFACIAIPTACEHNVSCACVGDALSGRGATTCVATAGNLTVHIDVP